MGSVRIDIGWSILAFAISIVACLYLYGGVIDASVVADANYDSRGYFSLGQAIWQRAELPVGRLAQRGYLYPLIATSLVIVSPVALFVTQALAMSTGVFCLLRTERVLTGGVLVSPFALIGISLMLSPAHMMTESFAFSLAAGAAYVLVSGRKRSYGVLLLLAAAMVKP